MKSRTTPQKCNLKKKSEQERKTERFLRSSAADEIQLREALTGMNTAQVVKILGEEVEKRFGAKGRSADYVTKKLLPDGVAVSWYWLDVNIVSLCRDINEAAAFFEKQRSFLQPGYEDMPEIQYQLLDFFDKARYIIRFLNRNGKIKRQPPPKTPNRRRKAPEEEKIPGKPVPTPEQIKNAEEQNKIREMVHGFATCALCWRSVPRNPEDRKTPLCYEHDMMSTAPEYRRRVHMRHRVNEILDELDETVPSPHFVKSTLRIPPQEFYYNELRKLNGKYFPHVVDYMIDNGLPNGSPETIMRSLERPIPYNKLPELVQKAWEFFFADAGAYFELHFEKFLLAEAWLRAEAEGKYGGKREKKHC